MINAARIWTASDIEETRPKSESAASSEHRSARASVLVCDDHVEIVEMLTAVLQLEGYDAIPAYCGTEVLRIAQERPIDLVLLDKALPDIDGFEVCQRLKALDPLHFLPVILVTAKAHKQDKLTGLNVGADDYIIKPFDLEELLAKVRAMLRIKSVEDQLSTRNRELASFNAIAGVIGESIILEEMLHNSLGEIMRLMKLQAGWVFLLDDATATLRLAVYRGLDADAAQQMSRLHLHQALLESTTVARDEDWVRSAFCRRNGLTSCLTIPLKSKGRILGCMKLASHHDRHLQSGGSEWQVLQSLGFELGIAVEHALLYRDAQYAVEELRNVNALKSRFISTASHEFRTPLSIIKGLANLLLRRDDFGFDRATEKQYLTLIDGQINALTGLVEDMLNASHIESGRVEPRPVAVDLRAAIERIATPLAMQARERNLTIRLAPGPEVAVWVDRAHLDGIISNLLSNAVKYSDDGTTVTVTAAQGDEGARLEVEDQGVGIAPEAMPRLFERFVRLENRRSVEAGGTGLGLYITKSWVEANGGRIEARSEPERGSLFTVTLPLATPHP